MLCANEWSTVSSSAVAKGRGYWKFVTEGLSECCGFCWEHGGSGGLCRNLEPCPRALLAGGRGGRAPGPPCSCSATFLSIFHAATQNGSDRNVCYYAGVFAFSSLFSRVYPRKNCRCAAAGPRSRWRGAVGNTAVHRGQRWNAAAVLLFFSFSEHHFKSWRDQCVLVCLFLTQEMMKRSLLSEGVVPSETAVSGSREQSGSAVGRLRLVQPFTGSAGVVCHRETGCPRSPFHPHVLLATTGRERALSRSTRRRSRHRGFALPSVV